MKMHSKLALVLAIIMVFALVLPGCGTKDNSTSGDKSSTSSNTGWKIGDPKKEVELSIALWDATEFGNDDIGKKIMDDLKVKINIIGMGWDNLNERYSLYAATNTLPDALAMYPGTSEIQFFYKWYAQKLIRPIPQDLINQYPTVKSVFENDPPVNAFKETMGEYWYLPRPESLNYMFKADQIRIFYRKDWLANLGIAKVPETVDEFYQYAKACVTNDPDKNGKPDTYGMLITGGDGFSLQTMFPIWGVDLGGWTYEDGKWIPGYLSKKCIDALKFFRTMYQEGIIDPEYANTTNSTLRTKWSNANFGSILKNGDMIQYNRWIWRSFAQVNKLAATADESQANFVDVLPPLKKDASSQPAWPRFIGGGGTVINAGVSDEKLDRLLELDEYCMKPETKDLFDFGFEGKHYTKDASGAIVPMTDPATNEPYVVNNIFPSIQIGELSDWNFDRDILSPNFSQNMKDGEKRAREAYNAAAFNDNLAVRFIYTPSKAEVNVDWAGPFNSILVGTDPVEDMFNSFVEEKMSFGLGSMIDEVTKTAAEKGIKP